MDTTVEAMANGLAMIRPELLLIASAYLMYLAAAFVPGQFQLEPVNTRSSRTKPSGSSSGWAIATVSIIGVALILAVTVGRHLPAVSEAHSFFWNDALTRYIRIVTLVAGIVLVLIGWRETRGVHAGEYHACLLLILGGVNLLAASNDLIAVFLSLELISVPTYVMLYLPRQDRQSQEATLKYFLLSIFSSGLFLYGASFLYGATGLTNFEAIRQSIGSAEGRHGSNLLMIALVLMTTGLSFRMTAVPFHFYAPDVFQGVPNVLAAMLSFFPKIAGFVAMIRIVSRTMLLDGITNPLTSFALEARPLLWVLAVMTMFVGNLLALLQTNIRRLLAYSSIAHAGYMLVGLAVGQSSPGATGGLEALLFYLTIYGGMTLGLFAILAALGSTSAPVDRVSDLNGLSRRHPVMAASAAVFLFSLTGLPPTGGFWGKFDIFMAAWSSGSSRMKLLAFFMAINAAIGAWYYLRLVGAMYLNPNERAEKESLSWPAMVGATACLLMVVVLFVVPETLHRAVLWAIS